MNKQNLLEKIDPNNLEISPQAMRAANVMPQKEKSGKTMFKMPKAAFDCISIFAKIDGIDSVKGALDSIAKYANESCNSGSMKFYEIPDDSIRKSLTINNDSRDILNRLAKENNQTRDNIIYSSIINLIEKIKVNKLTNKEKIKYAIIIKNTINKMIELFDSKEFIEAHEKLSASNDPDFGDFNTFESVSNLLDYVSQIYQLPDEIDRFIYNKEKENENN